QFGGVRLAMTADQHRRLDLHARRTQLLRLASIMSLFVDRHQFYRLSAFAPAGGGTHHPHVRRPHRPHRNRLSCVRPPSARSNCRATAYVHRQTPRQAACRGQTPHLPAAERTPSFQLSTAPLEGCFERFRACPAASHWVTWGHRHPRGSGGTPYSACCGRGHEPRTRFSSTRDRLDLCPACHYPVTTRGPMEPACCRPFGAPGLSTEVPRLTGKEPAAPKLFASWLALLSWPTTRNSSALVADDPPDRTTTRGFIMPGETMAPTAPRF